MPDVSKVKSLSTRLNPTDTFSHTISKTETNFPDIEQEEIRSHLSGFMDTLTRTDYIHDKENIDYIWQELQDFYNLNDNDIFWSTLDYPLPKSDIMLNHLLDAESHGLNSESYNVSKLLNLQQEVFRDKNNINFLQVIQLDIRLSVAYITYAWHIHNGIIEPEIIPGRWAKGKYNSSVAEILVKNEVSKALEIIQPGESYEELTKALERYRKIAYEGGWPKLPANTRIELLDTNALVPVLRERLMITQDLHITPEDIAADSVFDHQLESAVKRFQHRNGLAADGIVGKSTVAALNIPVNQKIEQIELNLERMRWMPSDPGERYIVVNIPEYKLFAYEDGKRTLEMRAIVGKEKNATPVFHDAMEYVVFSPKWNIPKSIIRKEIFPAIKKDSTFLDKLGYKLYRGWGSNAEPANPDSVDIERLYEKGQMRVVQPPGPRNALGQVKFMMPNKMNIYLHDTPADYLFMRDKRAFSHGCIRLEFPELMAEYMLKNEGWDLQRVVEAMNKQEPYYVTLSEHIPVYLIYRTAWVDNKGLVNFRKDIYNLDRLQQIQLNHHKEKTLAGL